MSAHERWSDSVGAYLLGALPPDELEGFRAHLAECETCRRDVEQLQVAADALPIGVPVVAPPPRLKDRLMAVVESEAQLLAAAGEGADRPARAPARGRPSWLGFLARPAVALACALALVLAGAGVGLLLGGGDGARTLAADRAPAGAQVSLRIAGDEGVLEARGMPAPPEGRVYQVWLKRPGRDPEPTSALWSVRGDGSARVAVPGPLDGVEAVLVTDEPPGGSDAPTRDPVIAIPA